MTIVQAMVFGNCGSDYATVANLDPLSHVLDHGPNGNIGEFITQKEPTTTTSSRKSPSSTGTLHDDILPDKGHFDLPPQSPLL